MLKERRLPMLSRTLFLLSLFSMPSMVSFAQPALIETISIRADQPGPLLDVELIANASRLPALLGIRDSADLKRKAADPAYAAVLKQQLRGKYDFFKKVRVGNLFFGYRCAGWDFKELAVRDSSGAIAYQFEETITMLDLLVKVGMTPSLALTGLPMALIPVGESAVKHPAYGCVNAPRFDWSKVEPRERVPEWWSLQAAFFKAVIAHFGRDEVSKWDFATWTEPYDPQRKGTGHLFIPETRADAAQFDQAVASIIAASIDAAMQAQVSIHIGNFAGDVNKSYPTVISQIQKFPSGKQYLSYITGYAISRYRVRPNQDIVRSLDDGLSLRLNPQMPAKPIFLDEFAELNDDTGARTSDTAVGLERSAIIGRVLQRVYTTQDGSPRSMKRVAFWDTPIRPRARDVSAGSTDYIPSAATNMIRFFSALNGARLLSPDRAREDFVAGRKGEAIYAVILGPHQNLCALNGDGSRITKTLEISGLQKNTRYRIKMLEIDQTSGNAISAFLNESGSYRCDSGSSLVNDGKDWKFSSPRKEKCFYEEEAACAWREAGTRRAAPRSTQLEVMSSAAGVLTTPAAPMRGGALSLLVEPAGK
jgi:hypothetical protein